MKPFQFLICFLMIMNILSQITNKSSKLSEIFDQIGFTPIKLINSKDETTKELQTQINGSSLENINRKEQISRSLFPIKLRMLVPSLTSVDITTYWTGNQLVATFTITGDITTLTPSSVSLAGKSTFTTTTIVNTSSTTSQSTLQTTFPALQTDTYTPTITFTNASTLANSSVTIVISDLILSVSPSNPKIAGGQTLTIVLNTPCTSLSSNPVNLGYQSCSSPTLSTDKKTITCTTQAYVATQLNISVVLSGKTITDSFPIAQVLTINSVTTHVPMGISQTITFALDQTVTSTQINSISAVYGGNTVSFTITNWGTSLIATATFPVAGTYLATISYLTATTTITIEVIANGTGTIDVSLYSTGVTISSKITITSGMNPSSVTSFAIVKTDTPATTFTGSMSYASGVITISGFTINIEGVYNVVLTSSTGSVVLYSSFYIGNVSSLTSGSSPKLIAITNNKAVVTTSILSFLTFSSLSVVSSGGTGTVATSNSVSSSQIQFSFSSGLPVGTYTISITFSQGLISSAGVLLTVVENMSITSYTATNIRALTTFSLVITFTNMVASSSFTSFSLVSGGTSKALTKGAVGSNTVTVSYGSTDLAAGSYTLTVVSTYSTITASTLLTVGSQGITTTFPFNFAYGSDVLLTITFSYPPAAGEISSASLGGNSATPTTSGSTVTVDFGISIPSAVYTLSLTGYTNTNAVYVYGISAIDTPTYFTNSAFILKITFSFDVSAGSGGAANSGVISSVVLKASQLTPVTSSSSPITTTSVTATFPVLKAGQYYLTINFSTPNLSVVDTKLTFPIIINDLVSQISPASLNPQGNDSLNLLLSSSITTVTSVKIGTTICASPLVANSLTITCTTGAIAQGAVTITIVAGTATNTVSGIYTIVNIMALNVSLFSPADAISLIVTSTKLGPTPSKVTSSTIVNSSSSASTALTPSNPLDTPGTFNLSGAAISTEGIYNIIVVVLPSSSNVYLNYAVYIASISVLGSTGNYISNTAITNTATNTLTTASLSLLSFTNFSVKNTSTSTITTATSSSLSTQTISFAFSSGLLSGSYLVYANFAQGAVYSTTTLIQVQDPMSITSYTPTSQLQSVAISMSITYTNICPTGQFTSMKLVGSNSYTLSNPSYSGSTQVVTYTALNILPGTYTLTVVYTFTTAVTITSTTPYIVYATFKVLSISPNTSIAGTIFSVSLTLDITLSINQFTSVYLVNNSGGVLIPISASNLSVSTTVLVISGLNLNAGLYTFKIVTVSNGTTITIVGSGISPGNAGSIALLINAAPVVVVVPVPAVPVVQVPLVCTPAFNYNNLCVPSCPPSTVLQLINNVNYCINCAFIYSYFYKGACLSPQPSNTVMIDKSFSVVVDCNLALQHNLGSSCVVSCPNNYYLDNNSNTCVQNSLVSPTSVILNGQIAPQCGLGYTQNYLNICVSCQSLNNFELNGMCLQSCPTGFYYNSVNSCIDCSIIDPLNSSAFTSSCPGISCPSNAYFDYSTNRCISCQALGTYLYKGACVPVCPLKTTTYATNSLCLDCPSSFFTQFIYNNQCFNFCPVGTLPTAIFTCTPSTLITNSSTDSSGLTSGAVLAVTTSVSLCLPNPCNTGTCSIVNNNAVCLCPSIAEGNFCQYTIGYTQQLISNLGNYVTVLTPTNNSTINTNSTIPIDNNALNTIVDTSTVILNNNAQTPTYTAQMSNTLSRIVSYYANVVTNLTVVPNIIFFKIIDMALTTIIPNNFISTQGALVLSLQKPSRILAYALNSNSTFTIGNIFSALNNFTNSVTVYNTMNNIVNNMTYSYNHFSVQIFDMTSAQVQANINSDVKLYGLSNFDYGDCSNTLINIYTAKIITSQLISYDTSYSDSLTNSSIIYSNTLAGFFYDAQLKTQKYLTNYCNNTNFLFRANLTIRNANLTQLSNIYLKNNINIFNATSPFYTDRCSSYVNQTTGLDLPLSTRINIIFPGVGFSCSAGCTVINVNAKNVVCQCPPTNSISAYVSKLTLPFKTSYNYDLVNCTNINVTSNAGFYIGLIICILCFGSMLPFFFISDYAAEPEEDDEEAIQDYKQAVNNDMMSQDRRSNNNPGSIDNKSSISLVYANKSHTKDNTAIVKETVITNNLFDTVVVKNSERNNTRSPEKKQRVYVNYQQMGFCKLFKELLVDHHFILQCFLPTYNNNKPRVLRIAILFLVISVEFLFNAIFYNDDLIQNRNYYYKNVDKFWDVIIYQIPKSLYSMMIGIGVYLLFHLITYCGKTNTKKYNIY